MELSQRNKVGVAGERGKRLVGGIAEAGGPEWADLPVGESRLRQEIYELEAMVVERADPVVAWQGCRVQEDSGSAVIEPIE